ncbi:MAG: pyridoxal-phosphate-dependent aminotransferase family protein [Gemmatimonadaceae bacterium]
MSDAAFGRFFLPGPTEVRPEVLAAMTRPMIPHRGREFEALYERLQDGLALVFRTTQPVLISTSSATGMMEAAIRCAPPGRILALVNGAFSDRFARIGTACGRDVDVLEAPLGEAVALDRLGERLAGGGVTAVLVVHSETSTGVRTDVRAVSDVAHAHGALCLIDSVTGIGGIPLEFDEWELDFVLAGSQKALALPPGLAFAVASPTFLEDAEHAAGRGVYFDLAEFAAFDRKSQTPSTPAISLLFALEVQLHAIRAETMDARWARHDAMAATTAAWCRRLTETSGREFDILASPDLRAQTVSAITLPPDVHGSEVVARTAAAGYTIGTGYGVLKERTIRIGHMGDHSVPELERCLAAVEMAVVEGR